MAGSVMKGWNGPGAMSVGGGFLLHLTLGKTYIITSTTIIFYYLSHYYSLHFHTSFICIPASFSNKFHIHTSFIFIPASFSCQLHFYTSSLSPMFIENICTFGRHTVLFREPEYLHDLLSQSSRSFAGM